MSTKGIFTALSGAKAQDSRIETISNNIANSNTTSFKKDRQVFNEYLTANEKGTDVLQVPKIPASIESFYDMQGGDKSYVDVAGSYTNFSQGALKPTGNVFDVGIEGKGFLEVLTPQGVKFTRNGALKVNSEGVVINQQGFPVLKKPEGQADEQRKIQIQGSNITISYAGDIYEGGEFLGKLSVVDFKNNDVLKKTGAGLYQLKNNSNEQPQAATEIKLHQGFLEGSNVNIVEEMTELISATRAFQSTQEAIKAFDSMNDKLVNVVPKVN